jgi:transcriptional regulator with XRE-family HTH domain
VTPLRKARLAKGWILEDVVRRLAAIGETIDTGNLSRLERGKQRASVELAESLAKIFGKRSLTEMQVLYPERYMDKQAA